ncbi:MAG: aspartate 1-decarboxylase [Candidatus Altiarchaeota archaeon]
MKVSVLKSKIHNATVSSINRDYVGSIRIDKRLVEEAGLVEYEKVLVSNMTNGERFETYVILGDEEGVIEVNGAAAVITNRGDRIIIMSFTWLDDGEVSAHTPKVVVVDDKNKSM